MKKIPSFLSGAWGLIVILSIFSSPSLWAKPVKVRISGHINGTGRISIADAVAVTDDQGHFNTLAWVEPFASYRLVVNGSYTDGNIIIEPLSRTVTVYNADVQRNNIYTKSSPQGDAHNVEIRPKGGVAPPGIITSLSPDDIKWSVSLGRSYKGDSAGRLVITRPSISGTAFGREVLQYHGTSGQTRMIPDSSGRMSQIITPEAFVNITDLPPDDTPGFRIDFYPKSALGQNPSPPYLPQAGARPYISHVIKPPQSSDDPLDVATIRGDVVTMASITDESALVLGEDLGGQFAEETLTVATAPNGDRIETITVTDENGAASKIENTYRTFNWEFLGQNGRSYSREDLVRSVANPDGVNGHPQATAYEYHHSAYYEEYIRATSEGLLAKVTAPSGNWVRYDYFINDSSSSDPLNGRLNIETRPWLDGAANRTIHYDWIPDWNTAYSLPASRIERIGNIEIARTTGEALVNQTANGLKYFVYTQLMRGDNGETMRTISKYYQPAQDYHAPAGSSENERSNRTLFNGRPYSIEQPGGLKVSYAYQRGNMVSGNFVPCDNFAQSATALREISITGLAEDVPGVTSETWDNVLGTDIDAIHLVPMRSVMSVVLRENGRVIREETHMFTGSTDFDQVSGMDYSHTDSGQIRERRNQATGATYTAEWVNEFCTSAITETGECFDYSPDFLNRVQTATRRGSPSDGQPDSTTVYVRDAAGRITQQKLLGGGLRMQDFSIYNPAGAVVSHTDVNGYTSATSESADGRVTTSTMACGGTVITTRYLDGRTKSVTGDGVVARYYTYDVTNGGHLVTTVHYGSADSGSWERVTTDKLGRTRKKESPLPGYGPEDQTAVATIEYFYKPGTALLAKTTQPGSAPILYEYDALGALVASGLDVNGDGRLTPDSPDRYTTSSASYYYHEELGLCWRQTTATYTENGSASKLASTQTFTRLGGFNQGLRSEVHSIDAFGNTTISRVVADPARRLLTETVTLPGGIPPSLSEPSDPEFPEDPETNPEGPASMVPTLTSVTEYYNGRLSSATNFLGETTRYAYDGLDRLVLTTPHRTRAVETLYMDGGGFARSLVYQTQYAGGGPLITRYGYDSGGRVNYMLDALGAEVHRKYNCRKELVAQWGTGTYPVTYAYDDLGRLQEQRTYRGLSGAEEPGTTADRGDPTTFDYHGDTGWLMSRADAASPSRSIFYAYDEAGRPSAQNNARGQTISFSYDPQTGELIEKAWSAPLPGDPKRTESITYAYTRAGALASVADPATGTRTFAYDTAHGIALARESLPAFYGSRRLDYMYQESLGEGSLPGRLQSYSLAAPSDSVPAGVTELSAAFTFNINGQVSTVTAAPHGRTERAFAYAYHENAPGLIVGVSEAGSGYHREQTWEADRNLLASISTSFGAGEDIVLKSRHDYTHDVRGMRSSAVQSGAFFADYGEATTMRHAYNARGELTDTTQHMGGNAGSSDRELPGRQWAYAYDSAGNRTSANGALYETNALNQIISREHNARHLSGTRATGVNVVVSGPPGSVRTTAAYEGRFWSAELLLDNADGPAKGATSLYFGKAGEDGAPGAAIRRDPQTDPGLALFMPKSPERLDYDADGNLVSDGRWKYTYNALNQLAEMETASRAVRETLLGIPQGEQPRKLIFAYDYMGRRVSKTVYAWMPDTSEQGGSWLPDAATSRRYLYQGWNLVAEYDFLSSEHCILAVSYHWGLDSAGTLAQTGGIGALLMIQDGDTHYFPAYDGNGNVTGLIDGNGNTAAAYEYTPYGELLRCEGPYARKNPFRFSSRYWDDDTGLANTGSIYYSPALGRRINTSSPEASDALAMSYGATPATGLLASNQYDELLSGYIPGITGWSGPIPETEAEYERRRSLFELEEALRQDERRSNARCYAGTCSSLDDDDYGQESSAGLFREFVGAANDFISDNLYSDIAPPEVFKFKNAQGVLVSIEYYQDGSSIITNPDGKQILMTSDGTIFVKKAGSDEFKLQVATVVIGAPIGAGPDSEVAADGGGTVKGLNSRDGIDLSKWQKIGTLYINDIKTYTEAKNAIIAKAPVAKAYFEKLESNSNSVILNVNTSEANNFFTKNLIINWDPLRTSIASDYLWKSNGITSLIHEISHFYNFSTDPESYAKRCAIGDRVWCDLEEKTS